MREPYQGQTDNACLCFLLLFIYCNFCAINALLYLLSTIGCLFGINVDSSIIKTVLVQMISSPRHATIERRSIGTGEVLLNKLEEVNKSVKVNNFFSSFREEVPVKFLKPANISFEKENPQSYFLPVNPQQK